MSVARKQKPHLNRSKNLAAQDTGLRHSAPVLRLYQYKSSMLDGSARFEMRPSGMIELP
jgi:hypothetical protein